MSDKVTREEMKLAVQNYIPEYMPLDGYVCPGKKLKEAICALIEHGPEVDEAFIIKPPMVSREFVKEKIEYLAEHPSQHRLEMVLLEAGVTVMEDKNDQRKD